VPSSQEISTALSLLRGYHKDHTKQLLRDHRLPTSGDRDTLSDRVRDALTERTISFEDLVGVIDTVEEHGHHHVFLFRLPEADMLPLRDAKNVQRLVKQNDLERVFNQPTRVVDKPAKMTCTGITHSATALRVKWVEKREWMERVKGGEEDEGRFVYLKMERHESRAVNTLRLDLGTGDFELRISDAGKESRLDYNAALEGYKQSTAWLVPWDRLENVDVRRAIPRVLTAGDEVSIRGDVYHTNLGSTAKYTSHSMEADVREDPDYRGQQGGRDHLQVHVTWLPHVGTPLTNKVRTYLYADGLGNEVRFSASQTAAEVSHVLSRIRTLAQ